MEKDEQNGLPPQTIARLVYKLYLRRKMPLIVTGGFSYKCVVFMLKHFALGFTNWLLGLIY